MTFAGWALLLDAVSSALIGGVTLATTSDVPAGAWIPIGIVICAIAGLEIWIARGLLRRRRWLGGVLFPGVVLALTVLLPPLPGEPPPPLYSVVWSTIGNVGYALVIAALLWHRRWFSGSDAPNQGRVVSAGRWS